MTRIALVLGGGASLGAYVGGAVTELLFALEGNRIRGRVTLDVITGASAGALNAAVAARCLLVNRHLAPWIERAWVDAADAEVLLDPQRPDRAGWLDVSALDELTRALVVGDPAVDDEPSPVAGQTVRVGFTLANISGVAYDFPHGFLNDPARRFGTRVYADKIDFDLSAASRAGDPVWESIRRSAVASASFPFAFPPAKLARKPADYPGAILPDHGTGSIDMWYVDGGLFDNAPLGLARELVERDPQHRETDWRYVMVEPTLESRGASVPVHAEPPTSPVALAGTLAETVLGQGAARDWKRANKINARVEILLAMVDRLPEISERLADPEAVALGRLIGDLAERVAEREVSFAPGQGGDSADPAAEHMDRNLSRIETDPRYRTALDRVDSRAGRARLAKLIFVMESACGLRGKEVLPLYLVAPERGGRLAGSFMGNFGGFFSRAWRANDYRAGRRDTRRLLEGSLADIVRYEPAESAAYHVESIDPRFDSIAPAARARLEGLLEAETDRLLKELRPGPLASLFGWLWRPLVRRWAAERALASLRAMR